MYMKDQKHFVMLVTKQYECVLYAIDHHRYSVRKVLDKNEEDELIIGIHINTMCVVVGGHTCCL